MGLVLFFLHALFFMILSNLQIACGKNSDDIKTMQLYDNIDRIWKDLAIHGYDSKSDSIDVALINRYDCYNYGGPKAARDAADLLGVTTSSRVLDIGGGIGGPARAIADHTSAEIVSVELQEDLVVLSRQLTAACKLDKKINVLNKNVLDLDASEIGFDDQFIYDELERELDDRQIKIVRMMRKEALTAFEQWSDKMDKTEY